MAGYLPGLRALAQLSAAPIFWFDDSSTSNDAILHNATVVFVDVGNCVVGITAAHVLEQYRADKRAYPSLVCQLGGVRFDPLDRLHSIDSNLDLATFSVPELMVTASGRDVHRPLKWPPSNLRPSDLVMFGGYPGKLRMPHERDVDFAFVTLIGRVSQTSDTHGSIQLNLADSLWSPGERLLPGADLGGMSGGPVFVVRIEPIETLELAGFIYQYQDSIEIVRVRHASHISAEGIVLA